VPPLIKILLTVSFLHVQVPRELVHCALLTIITTAEKLDTNHVRFWTLHVYPLSWILAAQKN